jgi:hypothetical protein
MMRCGVAGGMIAPSKEYCSVKENGSLYCIAGFFAMFDLGARNHLMKLKSRPELKADGFLRNTVFRTHFPTNELLPTPPFKEPDRFDLSEREAFNPAR